jgi:hypothetical protein
MPCVLADGSAIRGVRTGNWELTTKATQLIHDSLVRYLEPFIDDRECFP